MQDSEIYNFIHNVFIGIFALFPAVNPIGTAFIVNPFFAGLSRKERQKYVFRIALYSFYICVVILFSGNWILQLFGISVPVVRIAGGILICYMGWNVLSGRDAFEEDDGKRDSHSEDKEKQVADKVLFPLTFPITCGAGTISVLFTLSALDEGHSFGDFIFNTSSILVSVIVICLMVYFMYLNAPYITRRLGPKKEQVFNRMMAFLILCVGIQILSVGVSDLLRQNGIIKSTPTEKVEQLSMAVNDVDDHKLMIKDMKTYAIISTEKGDMKAELYVEETPGTTANFIDLANKNFYDGLTFHRVIPDFVIQGGCPIGDGTGGPGYSIKCETDAPRQYHDRGVLSMAHAGKDTGGSQFFICHNRENTQHLDGRHTCFGKVVEGLDVIDDIRMGDKILSIRIVKE